MIFFEIGKILKQKNIIWILIGLLIAGGVIETVSCFTDFSGYGYTCTEYNELYDRLYNEDCLSVEKISEKMNSVYTSSEFLTGNIISELRLYQQIQKEAALTEQFYASVDLRLDECENIINMSIFSADKYAVRNARKTYEDFEKLKYLEVKSARTHGSYLLFKNGSAEFIMLAVILLMVFLFTDEYENNCIVLQRCSSTEKGKIAFNKLLGGSILIMSFWLLLFLLRFMVITIAYGSEWLFISLQSLEGCSSAGFFINGLQACLLYFAVKLLVLESIFFCLALFAVFVRKFIKACVIGGIFLGISYLLFSCIPETSSLSLLKWINYFSFLDTAGVLFCYRNINLAGYPVSYPYVAAIFAGVILVAAGILTCIFYGKVSQSSPRHIFSIGKPLDFSMKNNSLVLAELRKWLITPGMILVCSLAALGICIIRFPITETKADLESIYYKSYVEEVSGKYSQEKLEKLNGYLDRISDYELELMLVSDDTPQVIKDQYMSEIDKKDGLLKAIDYAYYLQENEKRYFVYDQGYKVMFGFEQGKLPFFVYRIISAAAMVLIAWYIFDQEKKTGMEKLITISSVGRKRVSTAKYINLFLASIAVSLVVWSAWVFQVSHTFNIEYLYAPASSLQFLSFLPEYISIGMALAIYFVLQWLYTFFLGALTGWLSRFSLNENVKLVLMLLAAVSLPVILMCL